MVYSYRVGTLNLRSGYVSVEYASALCAKQHSASLDSTLPLSIIDGPMQGSEMLSMKAQQTFLSSVSGGIGLVGKRKEIQATVFSVTSGVAFIELHR